MDEKIFNATFFSIFVIFCQKDNHEGWVGLFRRLLELWITSFFHIESVCVFSVLGLGLANFDGG